MKVSIILLVLGTAIGFAAGYWFRGDGGGEQAGVVEEKIIGRAPAAMRVADGGAVAKAEAVTGMAAPAKDANSGEKSDYLKALAAKDPQAAIAWAKANGEEHELDDLYEVIAAQWAKRDPRGAFDWARTLSLSVEREDAIRGVMAGVLEAGNEATALQFIEELPPGEYQDTAMKEAVKYLASRDLGRAFELTAAMGETNAMRYAGRAIAETLMEAGRFEEARVKVTELPYGTLRKQILIGMVETLAKKDVSAMMAWMAERPAGPEGDELFDSNTLRSVGYYTANALVRKGDMDGAFAWAGGLEDKNLRGYYAERIGEAWAQRSPEEAATWLMNALDEKGFEGLEKVTEGIFDEWIERDQETPFEMISQIADPETREWAAFRAIHELGSENPRLAAQWLEVWGPSNPDKSQQASSRMMSNWLRRNAEAASTWLSEQPAGPARDGGIEQLVRSVLREERDFATAEAWIAEVQDVKLSERLTVEVERYKNPEKKGKFDGGLMMQNGKVIEIRRDGMILQRTGP